ncbi:restriction endonuclease subunit S [Candidatus Peregrinibacteria bacterium CG11_big_fil_rev_8_21_14_0_20_49_14]|nr:MAG: restriction endonuclease subunit S [Candidatus Peregrinibacteria bacterium CG11_big_fil_rev_8_21_14_0_20_49_14]
MSQILLQTLGFKPKEGAINTFCKKYSSCTIEVDLENKTINYGGIITFNDTKKTIQKITKPEDFVVLECTNRLLEKGYKPSDIVLEKVYPTGHGTSGRLDILVRKNEKAFLMIECKTWGKEFDREFQKIQKDGGQLFTYFQQDRDAEYLALYASKIENEIEYRNEIVKIEESYRETSNVKDFHDRWSKFTKQNGVFDGWVNSYEFKGKALTLSQLKPITQEDSSFIFNRFLEILRHNVVSDKPNAFNKIFTLFLCKIIDENRKPDDELEFQWLEGVDDDVSFQKRLTDLYKKGMLELLSKEVTDLSDDEFNRKFSGIDENVRNEILKEFTAIRLQKNNEFAIKEVFNKETFTENAKVLKEIVELLQEFKIRYTEKQQYLSDFFELLLTTGLKQESGQFFTPVPIARFICRSIPLKRIVQEKLKAGNANDLVPTIIDYAAGSGHFLTESMDEIQKIIDQIDEEKLLPQVKRKIKSWKEDQFDWAYDYIYGIEKDYRLVKTAKVGCYLHGDGLAKVIHGDGLDNFENSKEYKDKLKFADKDFNQDNKQFDLVISNPPYSVSAFKANLKKEYAEEDFDLYHRLTDQSSEIECLFIERTKQLLKDGGIAAIILPSSILSNTGIYTQAREIVLKYFEIIAITELGSNTFMATGTNTVTVFLRKRNNYEWQNIDSSVQKFFKNPRDITVSGIEKAFSKYVTYVWEGLTFEDYKTLCEKQPNEAIKNHEIFIEYVKKIKSKDEFDLQNRIIEIEKDKLLYFILAYPQKIVLVKSGEKKTEKNFLGYEFSNRRGNEGIHSIQRGKSIDSCTQLFDPNSQENLKKASTYIFQAFNGNYKSKIDESLSSHISRIDLIDTLILDRADFDKTISLNVKKKIKIESKWDIVTLSNVIEIIGGGTPSTSNPEYWDGNIPWLSVVDFNNDKRWVETTEKAITEKGLKNSSTKYLNTGDIIISARGTVGAMAQLKRPMTFNQSCYGLRGKKGLHNAYLFYVLKSQIQQLQDASYGTIFGAITTKTFDEIKIPLPPIDVQKTIVKEMEALENEEIKNEIEIEQLQSSFSSTISTKAKHERLENIAIMLKRGKSPIYGNSEVQIIKSGQARGFKKFDFSEKHYVSDDFVLDERKLQKGDILINSSGVGTAGRVTLFDLDGDFVVDSHISILRLDKQKALPDFVLYALADIGFKAIEAMAKGQSGQIELSLTTIQNIKIPLPPVHEQEKIVAKMQKVETQITKHEEKLSEIPQRKEDVLKKYLNK